MHHYTIRVVTLWRVLLDEETQSHRSPANGCAEFLTVYGNTSIIYYIIVTYSCEDACRRSYIIQYIIIYNIIILTRVIVWYYVKFVCVRRQKNELVSGYNVRGGSNDLLSFLFVSLLSSAFFPVLHPKTSAK